MQTEVDKHGKPYNSPQTSIDPLWFYVPVFFKEVPNRVRCKRLPRNHRIYVANFGFQTTFSLAFPLFVRKIFAQAQGFYRKDQGHHGSQRISISIPSQSNLKSEEVNHMSSSHQVLLKRRLKPDLSSRMESEVCP